MPTVERERYRQALAALEEARQQVTRAEQMHLLALTRLRDADVEGFEQQAAQIEERSSELSSAVEAGQQRLEELGRRAEEQRILAVGEEIDEVMVDFDAALGQLLQAVESLNGQVVALATAAERAAALAADLPPHAVLPRRMATAARGQAQAVEHVTDHLRATLTQVELG